MTVVTQEQITEKIHNEVITLLGPLSDIPSGWKKQNCKLCHHRGHSHDKRERFGLRTEADGGIVAHCFNCNFGASWAPGKVLSKNFKWFLTIIGMSQHDVKRIDFELYKLRHNMESSDTLQLKEDIRKTWNEIALPNESKTITQWAKEGCTDPNFVKVVEYLNNRKLLYPDDFYWTPIKDKMYNKRAIIPYLYDGKIVGFTGRYAGNPPNKQLPKYMNSNRAGYIYNLDAQKSTDRKYVILTEGVLDAYLTNGISVMGSQVSPDQIHIINMLGKEIIVVPDRDEAGQSLFNIAVEQGWSVSIPKWEKGIKDVGDAVEKYGRILTLQSILQERDTSAFAAKVKRQMDKF